MAKDYEQVTIQTINKEITMLPDVQTEKQLMDVFAKGAWVDVNEKTRVYYPPHAIARATVLPVSGG